METVTMNGKGQITIPAPLRKSMQLEAGQQLRLYAQPTGESLVLGKTGSILDGLDAVPAARQRLSLEEMEAAKETAVSAHVLGHD